LFYSLKEKLPSSQFHRFDHRNRELDDSHRKKRSACNVLVYPGRENYMCSLRQREGKDCCFCGQGALAEKKRSRYYGSRAKELGTPAPPGPPARKKENRPGPPPKKPSRSRCSERKKKTKGSIGAIALLAAKKAECTTTSETDGVKRRSRYYCRRKRKNGEAGLDTVLLRHPQKKGRWLRLASRSEGGGEAKKGTSSAAIASTGGKRKIGINTQTV